MEVIFSLTYHAIRQIIVKIFLHGVADPGREPLMRIAGKQVPNGR
jgi:hypothetical protein